MNDWTKRWFDMADHYAEWSKDKSTKVGCVIVGSANQILAAGYNGFPRGIDDNVSARHERPVKYMWTEHAERNAIYNAARTGVSLLGSTMYVPWTPCADCARAIIQAGISDLHTVWDPDAPERWRESFKTAEAMLVEAGVNVRWWL
jgi:dCMP deaminase